jgi:uncharacterized protein YbjT (DUF2867 family)
MSFARYKGEAENALLTAGFPHVYLFRPTHSCPVEPLSLSETQSG